MVEIFAVDHLFVFFLILFGVVVFCILPIARLRRRSGCFPTGTRGGVSASSTATASASTAASGGFLCSFRRLKMRAWKSKCARSRQSFIHSFVRTGTDVRARASGSQFDVPVRRPRSRPRSPFVSAACGRVGFVSNQKSVKSRCEVGLKWK